MGNGPSDHYGTPYSPQITLRPDDISEIESTVLPQISLLRFVLNQCLYNQCLYNQCIYN